MSRHRSSKERAEQARLAVPGPQSKAQERERFLADRERQRRALQMWARKVTYADMGRQLGCSAWSAHNLVRRALENLDVPEAKERRVRDNEALDELERITWGVVARPGYRATPAGRLLFEPYIQDDQGRPVPVADQPTRLAAIGMLVRLQERRARLNGSDMPALLDINVSLEAAIAAVEVLEAEASLREAEVGTQVALPVRSERVG